MLAKQLCCTQLPGTKALRWRLLSAGCWMVCWEGLVSLVGSHLLWQSLNSGPLSVTHADVPLPASSFSFISSPITLSTALPPLPYASPLCDPLPIRAFLLPDLSCCTTFSSLVFPGPLALARVVGSVHLRSLELHSCLCSSSWLHLASARKISSISIVTVGITEDEQYLVML